MNKLTAHQQDAVKELNRRAEIARCRKGLIMYKSGDPGYAMFRLTAKNQYMELLVRFVTRRSLLKATRAWLDVWLNDPGHIGDLVRDLFHGLEREAGYKFKNYKSVIK